MPYFRGDFTPPKDETDEEAGFLDKVKSFFSSPEEEKDPAALEVLMDFADEELCGYYGIPEDPEEARSHIKGNLFDQDPAYGDPENHRVNGHDADLDAAVFSVVVEKAKNLLEDSLKGTVRIKREAADGGKHRIVIHYPIFSPSRGNPDKPQYKGMDTISGEARARKCELVKDLVAAIDHLIPETWSSASD